MIRLTFDMERRFYGQNAARAAAWVEVRRLKILGITIWRSETLN